MLRALSLLLLLGSVFGSGSECWDISLSSGSSSCWSMTSQSEECWRIQGLSSASPLPSNDSSSDSLLQAIDGICNANGTLDQNYINGTLRISPGVYRFTKPFICNANREGVRLQGNSTVFDFALLPSSVSSPCLSVSVQYFGGIQIRNCNSNGIRISTNQSICKVSLRDFQSPAPSIIETALASELDVSNLRAGIQLLKGTKLINSSINNVTTDGIIVSGPEVMVVATFITRANSGIRVEQGGNLVLMNATIGSCGTALIVDGNATLRAVSASGNDIGLSARGEGIISVDSKSSICNNARKDVQCDKLGLVEGSDHISLCAVKAGRLPSTCDLLSFLPPPIYSTSYEFYISEEAGSPDGFARPIIGVYDRTNVSTASRPFPGPMIRARKGDWINVTVHNHMDDKKTSIHFHGLHMWMNPWMDGVDGITQCGIPAHGSFTYSFRLTQTGTHWYHSHSGTQYVDGLLGPIVIDPPEGQVDPVLATFAYRRDYVITLQDWFHETSNDLEIMYAGQRNSFPGFQPEYPWTHDAILLNGRGRANCTKEQQCQDWGSQYDKPQCRRERESFITECNSNLYPLDKFMCVPGTTTRIRLINAGNNLPLIFEIQNHTFWIVARDGIDTKPFATSSITLPVSQRIDIIVPCNQTVANYFIRASIAVEFLPGGQNYVPLVGRAMLVYNEAVLINETDPGLPTNRTDYGHIMEFFLPPLQPAVSPPADERIVLKYSENYSPLPGWPNEEWVINNSTFAAPHAPLLQTQYLLGDIRSVLADPEMVHDSSVNHPFKRETTIINLEYDKIYEIVLWGDEAYQQHPWHIHGYAVDFVGYVWNENKTERPWSEEAPVLSRGDSFTVPRNGSTTFRFRADNPGPWFLHCHVDWHMKQGMALILNVQKSKENYAKLITPPPANFPICGSIATIGNFQQKQSCDTGMNVLSTAITLSMLMPFLLVILN